MSYRLSLDDGVPSGVRQCAREQLADAVERVREFNRGYTRLIGALDYEHRLGTPYSLPQARVLYELARYEETPLARLRGGAEVDLILMDIMMPELDGYQTTEAIRAMPEYARLPIIALTAKAMKGDREKSIAAGASDYITKPVDVDQLVSLMRVWLYR